MASNISWPFESIEEFYNNNNEDPETEESIETDNRLFLKETMITEVNNFNKNRTKADLETLLVPLEHTQGSVRSCHDSFHDNPYDQNEMEQVEMPEKCSEHETSPNCDSQTQSGSTVSENLFLGNYIGTLEFEEDNQGINHPISPDTNLDSDDDLEDDPDYDPDDYDTSDEDDSESDDYSSDDADLYELLLFQRVAVALTLMIMAIFFQAYPFECREHWPYIFTLLSKVFSLFVFVTNFYIWFWEELQ